MKIGWKPVKPLGTTFSMAITSDDKETCEKPRDSAISPTLRSWVEALNEKKKIQDLQSGFLDESKEWIVFFKN